MTSIPAMSRTSVSRSRSSRIMVAVRMFTGGLSKTTVRTPASRLVRRGVKPLWAMALHSGYTKWQVFVLDQPTRFNELKRRLDGVTQRVLTQTLRRLERNGMIERTVLPTSPVGVAYSLTPLDESLRAPFVHLYDWTIQHRGEIETHQRAYDETVAPLRTAETRVAASAQRPRRAR